MESLVVNSCSPRALGAWSSIGAGWLAGWQAGWLAACLLGIWPWSRNPRHESTRNRGTKLQTPRHRNSRQRGWRAEPRTTGGQITYVAQSTKVVINQRPFITIEVAQSKHVVINQRMFVTIEIAQGTNVVINQRIFVTPDLFEHTACYTKRLIHNTGCCRASRLL